MDLKKIGAFIAKLRKEKGLTQEKLGEQLDVNGKTVSKWERGINAPDISKLSPLSEILGISVNELLNGEYLTKENEKKINNPVKNIQYYTKKIKIKYLKIGIYIILAICFAFAALFTINNYNKIQMYSIKSKSKKYDVDGYIMYNQNRNLLLIKSIDIKDPKIGTTSEDKVKAMTISVISGNKTLFSITYNESDNEMLQTINSYLINRLYLVDELVKEDKRILTEGTDLNNLKIIIEYTNQNNKQKKIKIPLNVFKEYSNNKLMY